MDTSEKSFAVASVDGYWVKLNDQDTGADIMTPVLVGVLGTQALRFEGVVWALLMDMGVDADLSGFIFLAGADVSHEDLLRVYKSNQGLDEGEIMVQASGKIISGQIIPDYGYDGATRDLLQGIAHDMALSISHPSRLDKREW